MGRTVRGAAGARSSAGTWLPTIAHRCGGSPGDAITPAAAQQLRIYSEIIDGDDVAFVDTVLERVRPLIAAGRAACETRRLIRQTMAPAPAPHVQLAAEQASLVASPQVSGRLKQALGL
ncbi:hypothetical protein [Nevskia sp.]|uniref:hypothetical protein n=1 Tax=Nevskia sp. TaxID=1929292 RepID=UPI003F726011